jgi:hypothetical protein
VRPLACSFALAAALLAATTVADAARRQTGRACAGLRVTAIRPNGDVVLTSKVVQLRSTGVACKAARAVARQVAKNLLLGRKVPARIDGYRIKIVKPCTGCAPRWQVTATGADGSFRFAILGGA